MNFLPSRGYQRRIRRPSRVRQVEQLEQRLAPAAFTVLTTADNGSNTSPTPDSLRAAIVGVNGSVDATNSISFSIPGAGVQTIALAAGLPVLTRQVTLDAWTQGGAGYAGVPLIELDGGSGVVGGDGLQLQNVSGSLVRGLIIGGFNTGEGILVSGGSGNTIQGNYIGTNAGGTLANRNNQGIVIQDGSTGNLVGIDADGVNDAAEGNVISGNNAQGLFINAAGTVVRGNRIGTNAAGTSAIANGQVGIYLTPAATGAIIGGTAAGAGNLLSGNALDGLYIDVPGAIVQGNLIGTNAAGTSAIANRQNGISLTDAATGATIGGTAAGAGNLVSGNRLYGLNLSAPTALVQGNLVGTNAAGTSAIPNGQVGVILRATAAGATIGGSVAGAGNVISGNGLSGLDIDAPGATVQGNLVGTDAAGDAAIPNDENGITLNTSATGATIGGTAAGAGNVISGSALTGLEISATDAVVQGNLVGTNATGDAALSNGTFNVFVQPEGSRATIGGTATGAGNVISGGTVFGLILSAPDALVQGNLIGTTASGTIALGNSGGISVTDTATGATIGGAAAGAGNLVSGNRGIGISILGSGAIVQGNLVGTDASGVAALPNRGDGIRIGSAALNASGNRIGGEDPGQGNTIAFNGGNGVTILGNGSTGNTISRNSIFGNTRLGIDLGGNGPNPQQPTSPSTGPNNLQNAPILLAATSDASATTVSGILRSVPNTTFTLEFFANLDFATATRVIQGRRFLGSFTVTTGADGLATFTNQVLPASITPGLYLSATATSQATGDTSEFTSLDIAPVPVAPTTATVTAGAPFAFGAGALSISDVDGGILQRLTLTVTHGTLAATASGTATATGSGTPELILVGTLADLNATLNTLTYTAAADYAGPDSLTVLADDQASALLAGPLTASVTTAITVNPAIVIDPAIAPATQGLPYSFIITATGGTASLTVSLGAGSLPPGLALGADGTITGTPTTAGPFTFTVVATDSLGATASREFTLPVAAPVAIDPAIAPATQGLPYSFAITATGGTAPLSFSLGAGSLPPGLTLGADGTISGTPTQPGSFAFTVVATDALGGTGSREFTLPVAAAIAISPGIAPATQGIPYTFAITATGGTLPLSFSLGSGTLPPGLALATDGVIRGTPSESDPFTLAATATGGTAPLSFAVVSGSLPPGLTLGTDGVISGTPTMAGVFTFIVVVTDALGATASREFTLPVAAPIAIDPAVAPATQGLSYTYAITATGGTAPLTFSVGSGSLPPGLTLGADGVISGTPAATGPFTFTVVATDALGATASRELTLTVASATTPPATITGLLRYGYHRLPTVLVLSFNSPLDAVTAQNLANYRLVMLGRGGRAVRTIPIASATYDPATLTVSLRFRRTVELHATYRLTIDGTTPGGVRDASGQLIDGTGTGRPGSNYVRKFGPRILTGATPPTVSPARSPAPELDGNRSARPAAAAFPRFALVVPLDPAAVDSVLPQLRARRRLLD